MCLHAHVPTFLTRSPALVLCVPTCSRANVSCVLTCSRAYIPCVLTCSRANVPCVFTCSLFYVLCVLAHVPTCPASLCAHVPTCLAWLRAHLLTYLKCLCADVLMCLSAQVLTYPRPVRAYVLILNNVNSYIIQICQLYLSLKKGNIGETLVLMSNLKFFYFKNFTFDQQFEMEPY